MCQSSKFRVKPGDEVNADDPLITLESDKASMDVPAPLKGKVAEILVAIGDKVSEGSAILKLDTSGDAKSEKPTANGKAEKPEVSPKAAPVSVKPASPEVEDDTSLPPPKDFGSVYASPSVRRLARELDIDLTRSRGQEIRAASRRRM